MVLAEIFYPWPLKCVCCGGPTGGDGPVCKGCLAKLEQDAPAHELAVGDLDYLAAAHPYAGPAGALVRMLKYRNVHCLAADMAREMWAAAQAAEFPRADVITWVPMHWRRRWAKYFNQAEMLARHVSKQCHIPAKRLLKRVRRCKQQARLKGPAARYANVRGAFRARKSLAGQTVLLIDDVHTTGATAQACALALKQAGAEQVLLLTYCRVGADRE